MLKKITLFALLSAAFTAHAGLETMSPQELTDAVGQGGADLSWTLSLNHLYATDMTKNAISVLDGNGNASEVYYSLDPNACGANKQFCRLAIAPNNHVDALGNKRWLVFKGIQGTLQIDQFSIDAVTVGNNSNTAQTAMQITFYDNKPLKIRNLGFNTLAIETGTGSGANEGYANTSTYSTYTAKTIQADGTINDVETNVPTFDRNTEKGFMGLNMHGNLHMSGNLKIFSYNCSGGVNIRC